MLGGGFAPLLVFRPPKGEVTVGTDRLEEVTVPPTPEAVKDYQRRMAHLAAAHSKALERLEATLARRAEALAAHDRRVAEAGTEVRETIASMAVAVCTMSRVHTRW